MSVTFCFTVFQILEAGFSQREKLSVQQSLEAVEAKHKEELLKQVTILPLTQLLDYNFINTVKLLSYLFVTIVIQYNLKNNSSKA